MHTDIKTGSWILRGCPQILRPYARLARLDRPIGIWLLVLPGWWAIMLAAGGFSGLTARHGVLLALFGLGAVVMRAAGCVVNDLWDRKLDRQVERTKMRPLASGELSVRQAVIFLSLLLLAGLAILLQMNGPTIALGILTLPFIGAYPLMKRITWWPQAFLGLTFNFGALMGFSAVTGRIGLESILLYVSGIFWTLGYDTIYAHQDKEDDALAGIKSTALKFGAVSRRWVSGFYVLSWAALAGAISLNGTPADTLWLLPAAGHLAWQITTWNTNSSAHALAVFKSNRDYGILVLAGITLTSLS